MKAALGRFRVGNDSHRRIQDRLGAPLSPYGRTIRDLGPDAWKILEYCKHSTMHLQGESYRPKDLVYVDHYQFRQNSIAINVEHNWLAFTMSNPVTAHAQLALVALTMKLRFSKAGSGTTADHSSIAVQIVRRRLLDLHGLPDDSLVGAVALLTIVEVSVCAVNGAHDMKSLSLIELQDGLTWF